MRSREVIPRPAAKFLSNLSVRIGCRLVDPKDDGLSNKAVEESPETTMMPRSNPAVPVLANNPQWRGMPGLRPDLATTQIYTKLQGEHVRETVGQLTHFCQPKTPAAGFLDEAEKAELVGTEGVTMHAPIRSRCLAPDVSWRDACRHERIDLVVPRSVVTPGLWLAVAPACGDR